LTRSLSTGEKASFFVAKGGRSPRGGRGGGKTERDNIGACSWEQPQAANSKRVQVRLAHFRPKTGGARARAAGEGRIGVPENVHA